MNEKKRAGDTKLYLSIDQFNSLISVLSAYVLADENNFLGKNASQLKEKILRYSREFIKDNETYIAVSFFPNESSMLIKLFCIYESVMKQPIENYYESYHNKKMKN